MTLQNGKQLALWLLAVHPDVFAAVYKKAVGAAGLGDVSDVLDSIGSGISDAASAVGTFFTTPSNITALTSIAGSYFQSQASQANAQTQLAVLQAQAARTLGGQAPAPISYVQTSTGALQPVYVPAMSQQIGAPAQALPLNLGQPVQLSNGSTAYPMTQSSLASLVPGFVQKYGIYIAGGIALLAVVFFFRSRS